MPEKASDSEMAVLAVVLDKGRATAAEVHAVCATNHPWAHSTVVTFLRRLESKGLVRHTKPEGGRAFVFHPTRLARSSRRRVVRDVMHRVFDGNPLPLVSSLLEGGNLRTEQVRDLQRMIEDHLRKEERK